MSDRKQWDIFCSVIDNFGDIGVTWRLARQLVAGHGLAVRLWVDDLQRFACLWPAICTDQPIQYCEGVEVHDWSPSHCAVQPGDVVIEAFGCSLPVRWVYVMQGSARPVLWLNLEYLSAEAWILDCHGLPSLQPGGLQKYFFFPGFQSGSGGLLREQDLLLRCQIFQQDTRQIRQFLQQFGVPEMEGALRISLFAYENPVLADWLQTLADGCRPVQLLVPEGRALADLARWLGCERLVPGECYQRGALSMIVLPFLSQDQYDQLLWSCDFNAVRGEDSFVRAQWAGRPMVWQPYPQQDQVHLDKLEAFLGLYDRDMPETLRQPVQAFWRAWNLGQGAGQAWLALLPVLPQLRAHAGFWASQQAALGDLAGKLVSFHTDWLS